MSMWSAVVFVLFGAFCALVLVSRMAISAASRIKEGERARCCDVCAKSSITSGKGWEEHCPKCTELIVNRLALAVDILDAVGKHGQAVVKLTEAGLVVVPVSTEELDRTVALIRAAKEVAA